MRRFAALYSELDACSGTLAKVEALVRYFEAVDPGEAIWALEVLLGRQRRRLITGRRLRQICLQGLDLPEWLFDDCHAQVGDSAETIALLWPLHRRLDDPVQGDGHNAGEATAVAAATGAAPAGAAPAKASPEASLPEQLAPEELAPEELAPEEPAPEAPQPLRAHSDWPLQRWMEDLLPQVAALRDQEQSEAVWRLWQGLDPLELLVVCKLLSGGLRVGVARGLVVRALARLSGLEEPLLQHRLMGEAQPAAATWTALLAPPQADQAVPSRPYPFFLASPLERPMALEGATEPPPLPGPASAWLAEWKWDGIRGQLIRRAGQSFLWSRGEELIQAAFPELIAAAGELPDGTVLDGEVIVWQPGSERPEPFASLQRRLGRRRPDRRILQDLPAVFLAYDLLERHGVDLRQQPLSRRRLALESLLQQGAAAAAGPDARVLRLSIALPLDRWEALEPLRQRAESAGAEGLMLKSLESPYLSGRRRGFWWKHKRDPHRLDAVLLYAQAGSGRRANLFTDYTFALWDRPADPCTGAEAAATPGSEPMPAAATPSSDGPSEADQERSAQQRRGRPAHPDLPAPLAEQQRERPGAEAGDRAQAAAQAAAAANPIAAGSSTMARAGAEPALAAAGSMAPAASGHGDTAAGEGAPQAEKSGAPRRLVSFAKAYSGLDDREIQQLDRWIRSHTIERYGPVRAVQPLLVFELAFEGLQRSGRHRSGIAVRFPRISRWRQDKTAAEADSLSDAMALLTAAEQGSASPP